ncbi:hypothetical protein [Nonomuraea sp. NPDC049607]|uniref:hypothetical protein n=1 Tax=Nonomuraea sp. NPDC049607 TaxID=3154732 RepID=UPI00343A044D
MTIAQGLPCLVILRCRPETMPLTRTVASCRPGGLQLGDGGVAVGVQDVFGSVERMAADVQAEHFAFEGEHGGVVPFALRDRGRERAAPAALAEQRVLAVGLVAPEVDDRVDGLLMHRHEGLAVMAQAVEGAGADPGDVAGGAEPRAVREDLIAVDPAQGVRLPAPVRTHPVVWTARWRRPGGAGKWPDYVGRKIGKPREAT